jgi:hypothetical protein
MPHNFNGRFRNALVSAKFVPGLLADDQELQQFSISENLQRVNDENLLKNIISRDKMWLYSYEVETRQQSSHWKCLASPHPQKT